MKYSCDFETSTYKWLKKYGGKDDKARIWAYGISTVGVKDSFKYGTDLDDFMNNICLREKGKKHEFYFHNLSYDGKYILSWLFKNGYKPIQDIKQVQNKTFIPIISDTGQWYSIEVYKTKGKHGVKCVFKDSMKLLNFSVEQIGKDFDLKARKIEVGEEFYHQYRIEGHILNVEEIDYLKNDVEVVGQALAELIQNDMTKLTIGSCAMAQYKKTFKNKYDFRRTFPVLIRDDVELRRSYKGGWTYYNKVLFGDKEVKDGIVLDVNSLYPWVMATKLLPYGEPLKYEGLYKYDELYPLFIQKIQCDFELKKDHLPTIQIKKNHMFGATEYLTSSNGRTPTLYLTSVDLKLFFKHYHVYNYDFQGGWSFKGSDKLFIEYVNEWKSKKIQASRDKNPSLRQIAKLMLNNVYGKLATNPIVISKIPYMENGVVKYENSEESEKEPIYIPCASFITSYAREKTISTAQKCYHRFIYADTDSLHLEGLELPDIDIDPDEFGAWDLEFIFKKAKFIRAKTYIEYGFAPKSPDKLYTKKCIAGLPEKCRDQVDFNNFEHGATYVGKLKPESVEGGVVLVPIEFQIK